MSFTHLPLASVGKKNEVEEFIRKFKHSKNKIFEDVKFLANLFTN